MFIRIKDFIFAYKKLLIILVGVAIFAIAANYFGVDKSIITGVVVIIGFITHAFTMVLSVISLVPIIGPIIVSIVSLPVFLVLNGLGYIVTFLAFRRGLKKGEDTREIMTQSLLSRVITISFMVGVVIGFILGRLL
jgi:hypothetical protein